MTDAPAPASIACDLQAWLDLDAAPPAIPPPRECDFAAWIAADTATPFFEWSARR